MEEGEKKEEKFGFDSAGEALGYISLDQAVLLARQMSRDNEQLYRQRLGWGEIVWMEISSDQREDSHRVVLQFRPPGRGLTEEQTGEEEFVFDLTGNLRFRQVLAWPQGTAVPVLPPAATPTLPSETLEGYLFKVIARLKNQGFDCRDDVIWQDHVFKYVATKPSYIAQVGFSKTFFMFSEFPSLDSRCMKGFASACFEYAKDNRRVRGPFGWLYSFNCFPVAMTDGVGSEVLDSVRRDAPPRDGSAMAFPIIYELNSNTIYNVWRTRRFLGLLNSPLDGFAKKTAMDLLSP